VISRALVKAWGAPRETAPAVRGRTLLVAIVLATGVLGCARITGAIKRDPKPELPASSSVPLPVPPRLAAVTEWLPTLGAAMDAIDSGRYDVADKVVADYTKRFPDTREGREMVFWRAMFKLDPNNKFSTTDEAIEDLDAYVEDSLTKWYKGEAAILLRLGTTISVLRTALTQRTGVVRDTSSATTGKSRDDEILALKEALARANAELDRIRKRVGKGGK
jgi:hypothetical protein